MGKSDTIKLKELHVNQQFYQEIINGFNQDVSQQEKKGKQPVVMPSIQSTYFKRRVLPIILKQVEKGQLLQKYYSSVYQDKKKSILQGLRQQFLKGFALLQNTQEQIDQQISKSENHSPGVMKKITTIAKWYRRIKRILRNYQTYKRLGKATLTVGAAYKLSYFSNQAYRVVFAEEVKSHVTQQQDNLVEAFKGFMVPGLVAFRDTIIDKLGSLWGDFCWGLIKLFVLPSDPDDVVDVGLWALSWVLAIPSFGSSLFTKGLMTILYKVIRPLTKLMRPMIKYSRLASKSSSLLIRSTAKTSRWVGRHVILGGGKISLRGKDKFNPVAWKKRINAIRLRYNIGKKGINLIDFFSVNKSDVKKMQQDFRSKFKPVGEKLTKTLTSKLNQIGQDIHFIEQLAKETFTDLQNTAIKIIGEGGYLSKYERSFGFSFKIKQAGQLSFVKTLRKLNTKIKKVLIKGFDVFLEKLFKKYDNVYVNFVKEETLGGNAIKKSGTDLTIDIKPYKYRFNYKLNQDKFIIENLRSSWGNKNYKFSLYQNIGSDIFLKHIKILQELSKKYNSYTSTLYSIRTDLNDQQYKLFSKQLNQGWNKKFINDAINGRIKNLPKEIVDELKSHYNNYKSWADNNGLSIDDFYRVDQSDGVFIPSQTNLRVLWNWYVSQIVFSIILKRKDNTLTIQQLRKIVNQKNNPISQVVWTSTWRHENIYRSLGFTNVDVEELTQDQYLATGLWLKINSKNFPSFEVYRTLDGKDKKDLTKHFETILTNDKIKIDRTNGEDKFIHFPFSQIEQIKNNNEQISTINKHFVRVVDTVLTKENQVKKTLNETLRLSKEISSCYNLYYKSGDPYYLENGLKNKVAALVAKVKKQLDDKQKSLQEQAKKYLQQIEQAAQKAAEDVTSGNTTFYDTHNGEYTWPDSFSIAP